MNNLNLTRKFTLLTAAAAVVALTACSKADDERTAGQQLDAAIAKTEQTANEVKAEVKSEAEQAKQAAERATDQMAAKATQAADQVGEAVSDAAVTASINAELAKDPGLSALKIDVDTNNGKVLLSGKAPDMAAKDRATRLASAVKGVTSVDNRLEIGG